MSGSKKFRIFSKYIQLIFFYSFRLICLVDRLHFVQISYSIAEKKTLEVSFLGIFSTLVDLDYSLVHLSVRLFNHMQIPGVHINQKHLVFGPIDIFSGFRLTDRLTNLIRIEIINSLLFKYREHAYNYTDSLIFGQIQHKIIQNGFTRAPLK